jgi:hypothetical protein
MKTDPYAIPKLANALDIAAEAMEELRSDGELTPRSRAHLAAQAVRGCTEALHAARALLVAEAVHGAAEAAPVLAAE